MKTFVATVVVLTVAVFALFDVRARYVRDREWNARANEEAKAAKEKAVPVVISNPLCDHPRANTYEPEKAPDVEVDFQPLELDLTNRYLSVKDLEKIQEVDARFKKENANGKNSESTWETSLGTFRVVHCMGRDSMDKDAYAGCEGSPTMLMRNDMLQMPNGKWLHAWPGPFEVQDVAERDGKVFLICECYIFEVTGPDKIKAVVSLRNLDTKWSPNIRMRRGWICGDFIEVHRSNSSDFGGLIQYCGGGVWNFYLYKGRKVNWIEKVSPAGPQQAVFEMFGWDGKNSQRQQLKIEFNIANGRFVDL